MRGVGVERRGKEGEGEGRAMGEPPQIPQLLAGHWTSLTVEPYSY